MANKRFQVHYVDSSHASRNVVVLAGNETEAVEKIKRQRRDVGRVVAVRAIAEQEEGDTNMLTNEERTRVATMFSHLSEEGQQEMVDLFQRAISERAAMTLSETISNLSDTALQAEARAEEAHETIAALAEQMEETTVTNEAIMAAIIENVDAYLDYAFFGNMGNLDEDDDDQPHPGIVGLLDSIIRLANIDPEKVYKTAASMARAKAADRGSPGSAWAAGVSDNAAERNKASTRPGSVGDRGDSQGHVHNPGVVTESEEVMTNGHDGSGYGQYHDALLRGLDLYESRRQRYGR